MMVNELIPSPAPEIRLRYRFGQTDRNPYRRWACAIRMRGLVREEPLISPL
jgi:hypothetical protein